MVKEGPRTTTDDRIKIAVNPLSANVPSSISSNREPVSNLTDSTGLQRRKQAFPKKQPDDGITIAGSPLR
jgi:hypothetical protein